MLIMNRVSSGDSFGSRFWVKKRTPVVIDPVPVSRRVSTTVDPFWDISLDLGDGGLVDRTLEECLSK